MLGFYSLRSDTKVFKLVQPGVVEEELKPISKKNAFADAVGVFAGTCCSTELLRERGHPPTAELAQFYMLAFPQGPCARRVHTLLLGFIIRV